MPADNCSYYNCTNSSEQKSMFRFPWNDVNRLKVWLENCGNMNIAHLPAENLRSRYLCIDHFNIKYVRNEKMNGHRKRLQRSAVPEPYQTQDLQNRSSTSSPGSSGTFKVLTPKKVYKNKRLRDCELEELVEPPAVAYQCNTPKRRRLSITEDTPKCKVLKKKLVLYLTKTKCNTF
ncbi:uncharacterized protein LOC126371353 [Pectinophora gossypiella]|uniref:uncharacterized protein LOC126371353 n=1 Tax=Pectinophora gossypiella TaxID=13191 RepID=UPI00214EC75F|nr:uncharacterized protein LOC126371353 [Pectinophora gossypiella]